MKVSDSAREYTIETGITFIEKNYNQFAAMTDHLIYHIALSGSTP